MRIARTAAVGFIDGAVRLPGQGFVEVEVEEFKRALGALSGRDVAGKRMLAMKASGYP
jgi:hypothetical protein